MAEGQQRKCSYCPSVPFNHLRNLVCHMREKHGQEPDLEERIKALPKDTFYQKCPHCRQPQSNLSRHLNTCKARQSQRADNGDEADDEAVEEEEYSNEEFLRRFEQYLRRPASTCIGKTITEYLRYARRFIELEENWGDNGFKACQWMAPRLEDCRKLRFVEEYLEPGDSGSKRSVMTSAYMQLSNYIERHLQSLMDNPYVHIKRAQSNAREQFANIKRGKFKQGRVAAQAAAQAAAHEESQAAPQGVPQITAQGEAPPKVPRLRKQTRLDLSLVWDIVSKWQKSKTNYEALEAFVRGETTFEALGITNTQGVGTVLALYLLFHSKGARYDSVTNLTALEISTGGRRVHEKCFYCGSWVDYLEHKKHCHSRRDRILTVNTKEDLAKHGGWQGYESGWECEGKKKRVFVCERHKTDTLGPIEHHVKVKIAGLVKWYGDVHEYDRSKDIGPFSSVSRAQVLSMLGRILKRDKKGQDLWTKANDQGGFGFKCLRQLAVHQIRKDGKDVRDRLRCIGMTERTAEENYEKVDQLSRIRTEYLKEKRASGPAPSGPVEAAAGIDISSSSDSDAEAMEPNQSGIFDQETQLVPTYRGKGKGVGKNTKSDP